MKTYIQFQGIKGLNHHFEFVNEIVSSSIAKFEKIKEFVTRVKIKKISSKYKFSEEAYECELFIHSDKNHGSYFFKKTSEDFYESIRSALNAAEKTLRRESKNRASIRRQHNLTSADTANAPTLEAPMQNINSNTKIRKI